jgi:AraC-like DNA-binding protein
MDISLNFAAMITYPRRKNNKMARGMTTRQNYAKSWHLPELPGVECFRAWALTHHYSRHSHETYSIGVIEEGVGGNECRGSTHYIPAGSIVVMNPEDVHTGYAAGERPLTYRMLYVEGDILRQMFSDKAALPYFAEVSIDDPTRAQQLRRLHRLLETATEPLDYQSQLIETLTDFIRAYGKPAPAVAVGREPKAVRQVKAFLQANYQHRVSIDDLVRLTHLDRAYLIRTFRRAVGLPPYTYLLQIRIERAKLLLAAGLPAAQVAYDVGFADQSHLTRHFKSITGTTPKQYALGHTTY